MKLSTLSLCGTLTLLLGCSEQASLTVDEGTGPQPALPEPEQGLWPTVKVAPAKGWAQGEAPVAAEGLQVQRFAAGLDHPRWLYVLPNGDVLVAETNAPARPQEGKGIKGWVMKLTMKRAGAATPSANRITLLRDTDGDGVADLRSAFVTGLNSPFGMALVGDTFYVANTDAVVHMPYETGKTQIVYRPVLLTELPAGPRNHHWTKNLIASRDGTRLYVSIGSNSNAAENGMAEETGRAAIWEVERASGRKRMFASGLRNPVGMAWAPGGDVLWTVVNERDELGSDLVPDYLTAVHAGDFYGWPYSYYGQHVDKRVEPPRPDLVARARVPDYALGPHTASLGLVAGDGNQLPAEYREGMFVGQHGSWNRKPLSGYRVIFVPFRDGRPAGQPRDVLTGFVAADGGAHGRPVGVAIDGQGALLVADDVGNAIWRVSAAQ